MSYLGTISVKNFRMVKKPIAQKQFPNFQSCKGTSNITTIKKYYVKLRINHLSQTAYDLTWFYNETGLLLITKLWRRVKKTLEKLPRPIAEFQNFVQNHNSFNNLPGCIGYSTLFYSNVASICGPKNITWFKIYYVWRLWISEQHASVFARMKCIEKKNITNKRITKYCSIIDNKYHSLKVE